MQRFSHSLAPARALVVLLALVFTAVVSVPSPVLGQTLPAPTPAALPTLAAGDSAMTLVDIRTVEQIQKEVEELAIQAALADERYQSTKLIQVRADTNIKVKESQIKTLKMQLDLAKKEKNNLKKADFEAQKKLAELEKKLLERRKALRDREISYWEATSDFATTRRKAFEAELALAQLREQRGALLTTSNSPAVYSQMVSLDQQLREAERRTLEALVEAANKRQSVAKQEIEVLKAKKEIFEAQVKVKLGG